MEKLYRYLFFIIFIFFIGTITKAQITIDDFSDPELLGWVPGSSKIVITPVDGTLKVEATDVGPGYEGFGKVFFPLNMSTFTVINLKIKVPEGTVPPRIRMDVRDNNGYESNSMPIRVIPTVDGEFHTYRFNFNNRFFSSWPTAQVLNPEKIVRIYFFINDGPNNPWTGTFYLDDIYLEGAQHPNMLTAGSEWKYHTSGNEVPTDWKTYDFEDTDWQSGTAPIGYGTNSENTEITDYGTENDKYITTYFRKRFEISDTTAFKTWIMNITAGDGGVIYLNEEEIYRFNMPEGEIDHNTLALSELSLDELLKSKIYVSHIPPLDSGKNIFAAEIHRYSPSGEMLLFDLDLKGSAYDFGLVRGPYLQSGTDTSMVIRWRTTEPTSSRVMYGTTTDNLELTTDSTEKRTEHEVVLTQLLSNTKYYYTIGSEENTLTEVAEDQYFITSPVKGTEQAIRIWAIGDFGTANIDQTSVRDSYLNYKGNTHTDVWLLLGDNAYNDGFDEEYQNAMFENMYEDILKNTVCWPSPGNHDLDYHQRMSETAPYYQIFTMPVNGEAGGEPSGTEAYYSYDYGNIHFISLDSHGTPRDSIGQMGEWLKRDLAQNQQKWIIAYWHHPPYSKGSHDSDDINDSGGRMEEIRRQILPILEREGADVILTGHSHNYERSYLIHGHYETSDKFLDAPHIVNAQISGDKAAGEEYYKNPEHEHHANIGTIYPIVGCSGLKSNSPRWNRQPDNLITNALMYKSDHTQLGSMIIDVHKDTLNAKFINTDGEVFDNFTIIKDVNKNITLITAQVQGDEDETETSISDVLKAESFKIYPNPFSETVNIEYNLEKNSRVKLKIFDETGKEVKTLVSTKQTQGAYNYTFQSDKKGTYIVKLSIDDVVITKKIIKMSGN
ncbi:MAG: metallophosphoesterase [Cytophagaceae bacterium]